jgi:hypothetical protein
MYEEDLKRLDEMVTELRRRRVPLANRSAFIRAALGQVSLDRIERSIKSEKAR